MRIAEKNEWISNHYQSILFGFKYKLLDDVVTIENISRICFSKCFSVFWPHAFEYHKHRKVPDLADEVEWPKFVKCPSVSGDQKVPGLIFFKYVEKYYRLFNLIRSKYPPPLLSHTSSNGAFTVGNMQKMHLPEFCTSQVIFVFSSIVSPLKGNVSFWNKKRSRHGPNQASTGCWRRTTISFFLQKSRLIW